VVFSVDEFRAIIDDLEKYCIAEMTNNSDNPISEKFEEIEKDSINGIIQNSPDIDTSSLFKWVVSTPHYFCKPYIRHPVSTVLTEDGQNTILKVASEYRKERNEHIEMLSLELGLSKRQIRKREKRKITLQKNLSAKRNYSKCDRCHQPAGSNCENSKCRKCCKFQCIRQVGFFCKGHGFNYEVLLEKRKAIATE